MTIEQIEAALTIRTDAADRGYMNRTMTEADYSFRMKVIDRWFERAMRKAGA